MPARATYFPGFRKHEPNPLWASLEPLWDQAWPKEPLPRNEEETLRQFYVTARSGEPDDPAIINGFLSRLPGSFRREPLGIVDCDVLDFLLNYRADRVLSLVGSRGAGKSTLIHYLEAVLRHCLPETYPSLVVLNGLRIASTPGAST